MPRMIHVNLLLLSVIFVPISKLKLILMCYLKSLWKFNICLIQIYVKFIARNKLQMFKFQFRLMCANAKNNVKLHIRNQFTTRMNHIHHANKLIDQNRSNR